MGRPVDAALRRAQVNSYPASFALLRVCLEHQLLDDLKERSWASTVATIAYFCWAFRLASAPESLW
jgi:hypothetical protein